MLQADLSALQSYDFLSSTVSWVQSVQERSFNVSKGFIRYVFFALLRINTAAFHSRKNKKRDSVLLSRVFIYS
ncbi:hypothetical protein BWI93_05995 [Siphonobacter sp. BAB-5385]|nr:hypothetical protein BWI93_05995 [Siphonobacter sp. BAB-5385]